MQGHLKINIDLFSALCPPQLHKKNLSAVGYSAKKMVHSCMHQLQNFTSQKLSKLFERNFQQVFLYTYTASSLALT